MRDVTLVLFDMNDVLCRYDRSVRIAGLAALTGREPDTIEAAIWRSGYEDSADTGILGADDYLRGFGERIDYPLRLGEWITTLQESITPLPQVLALAKRLKGVSSVSVLTNNNLLLAREIATIFPAVSSIFGSTFHVSAEFGVRKPDPAVYQRCVARLGTSASTTLFVDDSPTNVAGAEAAGLLAHRYTTIEALAELLERHGFRQSRGDVPP
jgi:FMN phosphatase YigB (HAD superfamily)